MAKQKYDGVVEAVRYQPDGQIAWVRAYERRGVVFSDHFLINRSALIERLNSGEVFYIGKRVPYMASTFEVTEMLRLRSSGGKEVLVTGDRQGDQDHLEGVPVI